MDKLRLDLKIEVTSLTASDYRCSIAPERAAPTRPDPSLFSVNPAFRVQGSPLHLCMLRTAPISHVLDRRSQKAAYSVDSPPHGRTMRPAPRLRPRRRGIGRPRRWTIRRETCPGWRGSASMTFVCSAGPLRALPHCPFRHGDSESPVPLVAHRRKSGRRTRTAGKRHIVHVHTWRRAPQVRL